jgi:uncharacterized membrane protein YphA (DoxX/SURF4 family)
MLDPADARIQSVEARIALALRVGLGLVFISGGIAKLERLLTPAESKGIVDQYVGPLGYINQTFLDLLFASPLGAVLTPWNFLTALSAFELMAGVMLAAGLMVRPLALLWAFLLWSFVVSLPVVTTPGVTLTAKTYMSPAELVQIRDIALSGLFFVLYNLGPGALSLDHAWYGLPETLGRDWEPLALLTRLSVGAPFVIGGLFAGYDNVVTWGMPGILLAAIGAGLIAGAGVRGFAGAAAAVMIWFMVAKLGGATSVIGWFNAVKREFAILAAAGVVGWVGGGRMFTINKTLEALAGFWATYAGSVTSKTPRRLPAE